MNQVRIKIVCCKGCLQLHTTVDEKNERRDDFCNAQKSSLWHIGICSALAQNRSNLYQITSKTMKYTVSRDLYHARSRCLREPGRIVQRWWGVSSIDQTLPMSKLQGVLHAQKNKWHHSNRRSMIGQPHPAYMRWPEAYIRQKCVP